jgi:acetyltransferase-like isoleucine patch superfamily enzyme
MRPKFLWTNVKVYDTAIIARPEMVDIGYGTEIYDFTFINGGQGVRLGRYNHIACFVSVTGGGQLVTGDYVGIGPGARILTGTNHYGDGQRMSNIIQREQQTIKRGTVTLEKDVFVGANAVVMPNITVGEGALVAAGAVVTHDVEPWAIVAGVPARVIGTRPRVKE